jgi:hypothetical protein
MPGLFLGPKSISNARSPTDRIMPDSVPDGHALVASSYPCLGLFAARKSIANHAQADTFDSAADLPYSA